MRQGGEREGIHTYPPALITSHSVNTISKSNKGKIREFNLYKFKEKMNLVSTIAG